MFLNTSAILKMVKFGRIPKSVGDKLAGLVDDQFSQVLGTHPHQGPAPMEYPKCAASMKNIVSGPHVGPGAKLKAYRDVFQKLRDSLKEGEVVRDMFCSEFFCR
jgi:hypothetical protein